MGKGQKMWRSGGKEDNYLKKLVKTGKITKSTKPADVKALHPEVFGDFSLDVFRNHFNFIKRSEGLLLGDNKVEDENDSCDDAYEEHVAKTTTTIQHDNYPVIVESYKDPETEIDMVILCICVPGGATNVNIDLNEHGSVAIVKYKWPLLMHDVDALFRKDFDAVKGKLERYHPKVVAYKRGLEKTREKIDVAPVSTIRVNLPFPVQTPTSTWTRKGLKDTNGTLVLRYEFKGHYTAYTKKASDMNVEFEL